MATTRTETIVVDTVSKNSFDDMVFTDKAGNERKIGSKRVSFFECIKPGAAVLLSYAFGHGKEYIYSAVSIEGSLPEPTQVAPPTPPAMQAKPESKSSPEIGLAYKELGEMIRAGIIKKDTPEGKACHIEYWHWLFRTLGISVQKDEPF